MFQLATANGYTLPHLHNIARLRKLNEERARYTEDFWDASNRLKLHGRIAKEQSELNNVNIRLAEATRQHLLDQRSGTRTDLQDITRIREEQRQKKSRTFVRLGRSARRSRRGPQRQELQLGCARHLCALRICDLEGIHGDLRAWRPLHFCHSLELKITFKVDVCGAHV